MISLHTNPHFLTCMQTRSALDKREYMWLKSYKPTHSFSFYIGNSSQKTRQHNIKNSKEVYTLM